MRGRDVRYCQNGKNSPRTAPLSRRASKLREANINGLAFYLSHETRETDMRAPLDEECTGGLVVAWGQLDDEVWFAHCEYGGVADEFDGG